MPTYCYVCKGCGARSEVVRPMRDSGEPVSCSCGGKVIRDHHAEKPNVGDREYARPIHSDALAIMPHQVAEHKKKFPDIKIDSECRPVFDSYRAHDAYLDKCGYVKHRQKPRRRGRKIATARKP